MRHSPSVVIVLVNWNGLQDTLACLESLAQVWYDRFSVLIVDNGSRTNEAASIQSAYPDVTVLRAGKNLGFAGGNNLGIRKALERGADYILCLNNDTTVAPDFLGHMVEAMETDPAVGIATCAVFYQSEPHRLNNLGCSLSLGELQPFNYIQDVSDEQLQSTHPVDVPFAEGCVLLMRRAVAETVSGFDDALFAYHEDADLCLRAAASGWRCAAIPAARVWHKINASNAQTGSQTAFYYSARNTWHVVRRHGTAAQRQAYGRAVRDFTRSTWRWFFVQCLLSEKRPEEPVYFDGLIFGTYGAWSGRWGLRGSRARWHSLEKIITGLLRTLIAIGLFARQVAYPLFSTRRAKGLPNRQR